MTFATVLALAFAALAALPAVAAEGPGLYYRVDAGWGALRDSTLKVHESDAVTANAALTSTVNVNGDTSADAIGGGTSFFANVGVGYRFSRSIRSDLTLSYLLNTLSAPSGVETVSGTLFMQGVGTGTVALGPTTITNVMPPTAVDSFAAMVNGYLDLAPERMKYAQPYLSAGLGVGRNNMHATTLSVQNWNTAQTITMPMGSHTHTDLTWSLGIGMTVPLNEGVALDFGYKYLNLGEAQNQATTSFTDAVGSTIAQNFDVKVKLTTQIVFLGLRF